MRRHANVSVKGGKALEQSVSFFRKCNATVTYVNFEGCTKSAQSAVRAPAKFTQIQLGVGTFFAFVTLSQIMKIAYLTAGAAGMYCGSCMNDNAVARALIRSGHDCLLVPVYTPIRTDDDDVSVSRVFLGGINVYLQQQVGWISMLRGFRGRQRKEFERLLQWLDAEVRPDVILLTNLLIGGAIPDLKARLKARVFVTIQGDDIFLDSLSPQDRLACETLMQELVEHVDGFFVHSHEYGAAMASRFMIPRSKWHVVPLGIATDEFPADAAWRQDTGQPQQPKTIGYLARMAPEKGLHKIVEALEQMLGSQASQTPLRLRLAGWMGPQHVPFWNEQRSRLDALAAEHPQFTWDYAGSVDRAGKLEFLRSLDLFCVPTVYAEPKGRFLLEAVCMGLPYVMPDHGAFPELHRRIQSRSGHPEGWLYRHDSINDLVNVVQQALLNNHGRRAVSEELLQELDINTHTSRLLSLLEIPANHP
jgi:glycosyltransferase involved in cell wall biosynthesis